MTSQNAPRPRGRPSLTGGRAQTVQTSLSPSQAAWVASRGVPVAAYLRGLVEADMEAQESPEVVEAAFQRFLVKINDPSVIRGWDEDGSPVMWHPSGRGRRAALIGGSWWLYTGQNTAASATGATEAQAIDWCLTGTLPDLVKIGGDV